MTTDAVIIVIGLLMIAVSGPVSRMYSGGWLYFRNRRFFRFSMVFTGVLCVIVGGMWMAGIGTR